MSAQREFKGEPVSVELRAVNRKASIANSDSQSVMADNEVGEDSPLLARSRTSSLNLPRVRSNPTFSFQNYGSSVGFNAEEEARVTGRDSRDMFLGSVSSLISGSYVNIEENTVDVKDNPTTVALHECRQLVLKPYIRLLGFLGWQPLIPDHSHRRWVRVVNTLYPVLVVCIILMAYVLQFAACYTRIVSKATGKIVSNASNTKTYRCGDRFFSGYLIPDILHSAAYGIAFYTFRYGDNEQLFTLMERVFLRTSVAHSGYLSQKKIIRNLRFFLGFNVFWVIFILLSHILRVVSLATDDPNYEFRFTFFNADTGSRVVFSALMLLGLLVLDIIYAALVINYAIQCQFIIILIRNLALRVRQKMVSLPQAMRDLLESLQYIKVLNATIATTVALVMFNFGSMIITATIPFFDIENLKKYPWFFGAGVMSCVAWFCMFAIPLVQAARVTAAGWTVNKLGQEVAARPYGYQDTPQDEINTFLLFTSSLKIRAKLFRVPIHSSYVFGIITLCSFIFLLLIQFDVLSTRN